MSGFSIALAVSETIATLSRLFVLQLGDLIFRARRKAWERSLQAT